MHQVVNNQIQTNGDYGGVAIRGWNSQDHFTFLCCPYVKFALGEEKEKKGNLP
jgi:hypothetical protein